jgi:hypothetical protein
VILNAYFYRSARLVDVTSATVTWDIVQILLRLPDISTQSNFHQYPTESMFSLVLKTVLTLKWFPMRLNFSEIPLTYGIMTVPWYIILEGGQLLLDGFHYRVHEFFWIFTEHQIMSYFFNFFTEIILVLAYDLR